MNDLQVVEKIVAAVKDRGLSFRRDPAGNPVLHGDKKKLNPELLEVLKEFREQVIAAACPPEPERVPLPPIERHRVFLGRQGGTCRIFGPDDGTVPGMVAWASWWRWSDAADWQPIPGRAAQGEMPPMEKPDA